MTDEAGRLDDRTERDLPNRFHTQSHRIYRYSGHGILVGLLVVASGGCATFGCKLSDGVVAARQHSLQGMEAMQRGRWDEAESQFSQAVATCPADERAHAQLAETLWRRGATDQAIREMERAAELSGGDAVMLVRLGEMYLARGDLIRAGVKADEAIRINRSLASAWALRGDALQQQGHRTEALAAYHRALSHQAHYPDVQLAVAEIYRAMGRPQRTLCTLESLADQYAPGQEPQQVLYLEGLAMKALGRNHDAVELLVAASSRGPASPDLLYHLGEAQMLVGDPTNARLSLEGALALAPRHVPSLQLRSRLEGQPRTAAAMASPSFSAPAPN
ncbi:MAG: tetratricopeptide repeat protein [Pirellulaceae bacterium]